MNDYFGAAAARAQQKRAKEEKERMEALKITRENNPLMDILRERQKARAEEQRKAEEWNREILQAFDVMRILANACGRHVESITYNGEVVFVRLECEAVKIDVGPIKDRRDLQYAASRIVRAMLCA